MTDNRKVSHGDILGLFNEISGHVVEKIIGKKFLLDDGRVVSLSDVHSVRTDNLDGTITETRYDGVIRTFDEDDR